MGIFGKLIKLAEIVSNVAASSKKEPETVAAAVPQAVPYGAPAPDLYQFQGSAEDYFGQILANCFPQLRVVPNQQLAGSANIPVSFLLYRNDAPVLAIILCGSQEYRYKRVANTVSACQARGIPVQRYYREFQNQAAYVVNRIQGAI